MPTITPIWVRTMAGSTPRTAKTAASSTPADVITPPVAASARCMPVTVSPRIAVSLTVGELAQRLGLSPAAATALVDRLETAGHVGRTRDVADRRRVTLHMQARALELATAFFVPLGKLMREAAEDLSDGDLARATSVIRQMAAAVTKARKQASG